MCREVREWYQAVGNSYYLICIMSIHHSIGKHTTVTLTTDTTAVAVIVTGWGSDKCDVNSGLTTLDRSYTASMGTHDCKSL